MYRIVDKRGSGKTSRLLLLAKEQDGIVVCSNPNSLREKAYAYGITGVDFISYFEYRRILMDKVDVHRKVFIDELEMFIKSFDNSYLTGYTISCDD